MATFISQIVNGLNQSAVLLIAALGLLIIFGLMNVINMAHGEMIMIGGFCAYIATVSYTHLDVYKRQGLTSPIRRNLCGK